MATAVSDRGEKESTKSRIGKQNTAEGFTTKASMKNVTVMISKFVVDDELKLWRGTLFRLLVLQRPALTKNDQRSQLHSENSMTEGISPLLLNMTPKATK